MRVRLSLVTTLVFLAGTGLCPGQERRDVAAQREAMKKLDFWVGEWKGKGWFQTGPGAKRENAVTEIIRPKLDGLALLIEGLGQNGEVTNHSALAILCYDDVAKRYRFVHYRAGDKLEETELKVIDGGFQWERRVGPGTARFTVKITGDQWHEAGEFSTDGTTWRKFMEMTLHRQQPAPREGKP